MTKTFCDFCKQQVGYDHARVSFQRTGSQRYEHGYDACTRCALLIEGFLYEQLGRDETGRPIRDEEKEWHRKERK